MLLAAITEQLGFRGAKCVEFALAHGVPSRTDGYDRLLLREADAAILEPHDDPYRAAFQRQYTLR